MRKFGELVRKIWSKDNFKSVISPHELVQEVTIASKLQFQIGVTSDAVDFTSWFLNALHSRKRGAILENAGQKTRQPVGVLLNAFSARDTVFFRVRKKDTQRVVASQRERERESFEASTV